jgi:small subunit ribosomal protein S6
MRTYEILFILRPDVPEEEVDGIMEPLKTVVTQNGGSVDKLDKWGTRKLAYRVRRYREGSYVLLQFSTKKAADTVKELERRLRVSDTVIKFLTVRIDEELKRLERLKKGREKRAAKKPAPTAATAPPETPTPGPVPGPAPEAKERT